ncbi:MAG: 2-C-methyl-D-erythritol 4-phosphate cytidylyltransferase [Nitrososphaerales archaeon]
MGKTLVIILAGGRGERFKDEFPKQFVKLAGKPIICHTIEKFEKHPLIDEIYLIVPEKFYYYTLELLKVKGYEKVTKILIGGKTRQESSRIGVFAASENKIENVLIHDAVRPFVSEEIITNVIKALEKYKAVDVAIPVTDTVIEVKDRIIVDIPRRDILYRGQTPQGFKLEIIKKAHELASRDNITNASDDCSLVLRYNLAEIYMVDGSEYNIKITYPLDLNIADKIFQLNYVKVSGRLDPSVKEKIRGKILIVFGGTSGIGEKIHNLWNELGGKSYAFSRRIGVDVTQPESVSKALEDVYVKEGKIDAVVITVGLLKTGFLCNTDLKEIINVINTNLIGPIIVSKLSIPYLKETKGSLLIFGSSSYSYGRAGYIAYSASKAALVNLVQGLADELNTFSIRVNIINPERTNTPMRRAAFGNEDKNTLLSPDYVARVAINVLLKDLTGATIDVRKIDEIREQIMN